MKELVTKIALELGWEDLGPQKSGHLTSFVRNGIRANFYEGTGTLTLQDMSKKYDSGISYKKVVEEDIRNILK